MKILTLKEDFELAAVKDVLRVILEVRELPRTSPFFFCVFDPKGGAHGVSWEAHCIRQQQNRGQYG